MKLAASISSTRVLARSFSSGMAAMTCSRTAGVSLPAISAPFGRCGNSPSIAASRSRSGLDAHVVAVEAFELGEIEARRRAADLRQVEGRDHFLGREDFLIAVAPAEPHQIVAHRRRQIAHRPVGIDAERAVALGKLGAVRPVDQRDVRHHRHGPAQRLVDLGLPRGVVEVVVAADDVGHAHVVVVHHHRQHVGRVAVGAQQHEIVEVLVLPGDAALDLVLDHGLAGQRRLQPDRGLDAGRRVARIAVAPAAVVEPGLALGASLLAHLR